MTKTKSYAYTEYIGFNLTKEQKKLLENEAFRKKIKVADLIRKKLFENEN